MAKNTAVKVEQKQTVLVAMGGYQHTAEIEGNELRIKSVGLPSDFSVAMGDEGVFPGAVSQRLKVEFVEKKPESIRIKFSRL